MHAHVLGGSSGVQAQMVHSLPSRDQHNNPNTRLLQDSPIVGLIAPIPWADAVPTRCRVALSHIPLGLEVDRLGTLALAEHHLLYRTRSRETVAAVGLGENELNESARANHLPMLVHNYASL